MNACGVTETILALHARRYPAMEGRDYAKLLHQSVFGPGHLLTGEAAAPEVLRRELAQARAEGYAPAYTVEAIGGGLCRFHLDPRRLTEEDLPLLCRCFALSARTRGNGADLRRKLGILSGLCWRGKLPVDSRELDAFLALYMARGCPPVHHSEAYRNSFHPHYRVIDRDLCCYFPALQAIGAALRAADGPILVAVDGRCGAGKSTFAARCAQVFEDCSVLHMDDFFLPPDKRTPQRLATPGGNVDYERAEAELLAPLSRGEAAAYRPFDCRTGAFASPVGVPCARLNLIEGAYALHPALSGYSQVHIFLICTPQVQLERLERREGREGLQKYRERWIPLEEAYFEALSIRDRCHVTVDTSPLSPAPVNPKEEMQ